VLLLCLSKLPALEFFLKNRSNHFEIHLELKNSLNLQNFVSTIRKLGLKIDAIELNPAYANSGLSVYSIAISISNEELKKYKTHKEIIDALSTLDYIYHIEEI
jgi:putative Mg2+ transporter-C (MgtC) family protein